MDIKASVLRDGTSQGGRGLRSQQPDYVSVDEKTWVDWLEFAHAYAQELTYFNDLNQPQGDWSPFFPQDAQTIAEALAALEADSPNLMPSVDLLNRLAQPHLALFLTFLKLLRYPQQQFKALTQRRLDFYYRQVLRLAEKTAIPDRVHVIVALAAHQTEYLLPQGTRVSAGKDSQGVDLHYVTDQVLSVNQAQVASVKTFCVKQGYVDLEAMHLEDHRTNAAFERVLRWAVGTPNQGDDLPTFPQNQPSGTPMDITTLNALSQAIKDYTLDQVTEDQQQYILNQLCFATLDDFQFCFDVHGREIDKQRGEPDVVPPTEAEWQQVYRLVEKAYRKKINRDRRSRLKQEHQNPQYSDASAAFLGLWRFALGDPAAGDLLPPFPTEVEANLADLVVDLAGANAEATARYIQEQLRLSVPDFQKIMGIQRRYPTDRYHPEWEEAYRLLERAQTQKRHFTYPPIGRKEIQAISATTIAEAKPDQPLTLPRFHPFIIQPLDSTAAVSVEQVQSLGIAVTSPVLWLQTGTRNITLTLACQPETFNRGLLEEVLAEGALSFAVSLSSAQGWLSLHPSQWQFEIGDFVLEPPLARYGQAELALIYEATSASFAPSDQGQYLHFPNGSIYRIDVVLSGTQIQVSPVGQVGTGTMVDQYASLDLGVPGTGLTQIQLSADQRELTTRQNQFSAADVGAFVMLAEGTLYQIEQVANSRRVGVRYWGYLPGTGQPQKYAQIAFAAAPVDRLPPLTLIRIVLTAESSSRFGASDLHSLLAGVNGEVYELVGLVSDREATVRTLGHIARTPTPTTGAEHYSASGLYLHSLQLKITLAATAPAITAPALSKEDSIHFQTAHPVVKILFQEETPENPSATRYYAVFKDLELDKAHIQVATQGLKDLYLRNDRTVISPQSPFEPFEASPTAGASFYFTHPEIASKSLDSLSLNLDWMGLPDDFATHYYAYSHCGLSPQPPVIENDSFQAELALWLNRTWHPIAVRSLFSTELNTELSTESGIPESHNNLRLLAPRSALQYDQADFAPLPWAGLAPSPDASTPDAARAADLFEHSCYFRLELTRPDFLHNLYPLVLNKVALSSDEAVRSLSVYPPYTPKIKAITLDYCASAEIHLNRTPPQPTADQLLQVHPFGYLDFRQLTDATAPTHRYRLFPPYAHEGSLLIGLRNLHPPQSLTLLFQLVSGSGNADLTNPEVEWSYLGQDQWHPFQPAEILADGTHGLVDSGILHLNLPTTATDQNHILPAGLYWLRATVNTHPQAIPDILDIRTQAVTATFLDQGNAPDHLSTPLAAHRIQTLVERHPAIATVTQPYSSFGGRPAETHQTFYTRVGERLRHKQRAITRWDYERLVLEQFPQIYKVKCLTQAEQTRTPSAAQVTLVVIPNLANTAPFLPLEPKAPQYLLRQIEAYLQAQTSPFVRVVVKNPRYERIRYRVAVRFQTGYEQGYYLKHLNEELVRFLSPWAYEEQQDIAFGSSIHSSVVIHFIESRPYVDYVANLKLIEQTSVEADDSAVPRLTSRVNTTNLAQVKQVDSILVSAPNHIIDLITTDDYAADEFEGINYMIIGLDFVVT